jgi:EAL domain-containing protein (putative c-di-GMP-specific phosphodiesterase class I)
MSSMHQLIVQALAHGPAEAGFEVHYQPIVRMEDHATMGVEALARWRHSTAGYVCTDVIVSIAERLGLMGAVDDFVLMRACEDSGALAKAYGWPVDVHVNVSATRLGLPSLEAAVEKALERSGLQPGRLVLEVTESAQVSDIDAAIACANRLRERGVRIALDDFGAGFSWLGRLRSLPVDIVKLDASTTCLEIDATRAQAICASLLFLCGELQVVAIAEGIETHRQAELLTQLGCRMGQGYFYSHAEPLGRLVSPYLRSAPLLRSAVTA